jgi:predicted ferric reductase
VSTIAGGRAARRQTLRRIRPRRSPALALLFAVALGAVAVVWLWWMNTPSLADNTAKILNAGRITGLLAGYLMALVVLQMARVPALERRVGSDRVARWHSMSGRYTISLVVAHVVLTMWGYALQAGKSFKDIVLVTIGTVTQLPDLGKASIGTGLLVLIGLLSVGGVRRRIPYDLWYHVHLLTYAVVFLTFWHQLSTGNDFVATPAAQTAWYALYGSVTALVIWYRILTPIRLNMRHRMRVEAVIEEAPGVVSVLITGRKLHRMGAEAGQFFRWRFLAPGMRFSSHPYSLSATPRPNMLRITVKAIGDHSSALRELRPGVRVWAEGPYGSMTAQRRSRGKVLLVAGGVGITPMRTLFETLPGAPGDLTLLYRANTTQDLALWSELSQIAEDRGARLMYAVNSPDGERPDISADTLRRKLPDIDRHDVFMCGPPGFAQQVYEALRGAGVPARRIHHESFEM